MQLELAAVAVDGKPIAPRVAAVHFPDLPLQRVLRSREASGLGGARRAPVAIEQEGRIVCRDAEARAQGVVVGDRIVQAQAACSAIEIVPRDEASDRALLESVAEAMLAIAPAVEIAWPDTLLLDASGARVFGDGAQGEEVLVDRALALARDLGLHGWAAVANGRGPSRALARHGGRAPGSVADGVMARLPVEALGLDPDLARRLSALGLRTAGDLARIPVETLAHRFGAAGIVAWRIAAGDDPSPLVPHVPVRLPEESLAFEAPVESADPLLFALKRLCDRAALRLAGRQLGATRLSLELRLDPGCERLELGLAAPSSSAARWLLVLRERVGALRLSAPVVAAKITVVEASTAPAEQFALDDRPDQLIAIETVLARLTARLGDEALFAAEAADRYRPESAYGVRPFLGRRVAVSNDAPAETGRNAKRRRQGARGPGTGAGGRTAGKDLHDAPGASLLGEGDAPAPVRPTRLLPRPEPLVALGEGGRLAAVRLGGRTLRVQTLSPAERLAGEWWSEPFDRDYHRVRLEGLGDCWVFRDARDGRLWLHGFFD